jgi:hypothetical protein
MYKFETLTCQNNLKCSIILEHHIVCNKDSAYYYNHYYSFIQHNSGTKLVLLTQSLMYIGFHGLCWLDLQHKFSPTFLCMLYHNLYCYIPLISLLYSLAKGSSVNHRYIPFSHDLMNSNNCHRDICPTGKKKKKS